MAKRKDKALVMGGLWFVLRTAPRRVVVVDPSVMLTGDVFKVSTNVINHYDLRIWASGYLAREA